MSDCDADGCDAASETAWERWMTPEEVAAFHATGDLPAHEVDGKVLVRACVDHVLAPADLMGHTHDAACAAPPSCDCMTDQKLPPDADPD